MDPKVGNFDWIVPFSSLVGFFNGVPMKEATVLVLGCGTSTLSKDLLLYSSDFASSATVVSVDNDPGCIAHMRHAHKDLPQMLWFEYDIVECIGDRALKDTFPSGSFGLIVDKGTLDAVLVEGVVYTMLAEVHRFLSQGGVYFVCSIHPAPLLEALLGLEELDLDVQCHNLPVLDSSGGNRSWGTVALCRKRSSSPDRVVNLEKLRLQEESTMNWYFQSVVPLWTPQQLDSLRASFAAAGGTMPYAVAYELIFIGRDDLGYSLELFLGDLEGFAVANYGYLSGEEAMAFLKRMQ